jgi:hypothetical protein
MRQRSPRRYTILENENMINLLPPEAHARVKREYWVRVFSVWSFLLSVAFFVTALLLTPSYVLLKSELKALELDASTQSDGEEAYLLAEEQIREANEIVKQLDVEEPKVTISEILTTVDRIAREGIELRTYSIAREGRSVNTFQVQGTAASREALAAFKTELERDALFESANVPISDLAREEDLPFVITLTITPTRKDP